MSIPYAPDESWNPITGCSKTSEGCDNCWAKALAESPRLRGRFGYDAVDPFKITLHEDKLDLPRHWRKPRVVATCLMGDLFHKYVSDEWIERVWDTMRDCETHTFIFCTKRPHRMLQVVKHWGEQLPNVWHGVSVENKETARRRLAAMGSWLRQMWVSCEPMLGLIDWGNRLTDVQGIIVGAESGPNARPFDPAWAEATQEACKAAGACFYMKQLAPSMGGADWGKWPKGLSHLKVRNLPWKLEAA